jgi:hypothetical protein
MGSTLSRTKAGWLGWIPSCFVCVKVRVPVKPVVFSLVTLIVTSHFP